VGVKKIMSDQIPGLRDDGEITLNREGLFMKKTNDELLDNIRRSGDVIDTCWYEAFPLGREVDLDGLRKIESHANALATYCKLLRQRLEAGQPTLTEGE
jgi:hypothetical protein